MKENNIVKFINLSLSEGQTEIILKSLEFYCFAFHNVWGIKKNEEETEKRNSMIFHTYEQIMSSLNTDFYYNSNYNIEKECDYVKKKNFYYNRRHVKKIAN